MNSLLRGNNPTNKRVFAYGQQSGSIRSMTAKSIPSVHISTAIEKHLTRCKSRTAGLSKSHLTGKEAGITGHWFMLVAKSPHSLVTGLLHRLITQGNAKYFSAFFYSVVLRTWRPCVISNELFGEYRTHFIMFLCVNGFKKRKEKLKTKGFIFKDFTQRQTCLTSRATCPNWVTLQSVSECVLTVVGWRWLQRGKNHDVV